MATSRTIRHRNATDPINRRPRLGFRQIAAYLYHLLVGPRKVVESKRDDRRIERVFPLHILHQIINACDTPTASSWALTCRALLHVSRTAMFRKISITRDTTLDYLLYTSCTSDIAGYLDNLRELVVANRSYREDHLAYRLAVLFPHLPSTVRRLEMYNTSWSYTPPALVFFTLFHSLNTLILVNCKFVSFSAFRQIIRALPVVSDLVLRCVKWESCDPDAPTDSQLRLTECLLCQVESLDIVLRWLYNSSSLHSLRVFDAPTTSAVWAAIDLSADELDLAGTLPSRLGSKSTYAISIHTDLDKRSLSSMAELVSQLVMDDFAQFQLHIKPGHSLGESVELYGQDPQSNWITKRYNMVWSFATPPRNPVIAGIARYIKRRIGLEEHTVRDKTPFACQWGTPPCGASLDGTMFGLQRHIADAHLTKKDEAYFQTGVFCQWQRPIPLNNDTSGVCNTALAEDHIGEHVFTNHLATYPRMPFADIDSDEATDDDFRDEMDSRCGLTYRRYCVNCYLPSTESIIRNLRGDFGIVKMSLFSQCALCLHQDLSP